MRSRFLHLTALIALPLLLAMLPASDAEASIFEIYAQGHGTLITGTGSDYFEQHDSLLVGGGAELGVELFFLHTFLDLNYFGKDDGRRIYWNQIGLGTQIGLPMPVDKLDLYLRGHATYTSATFLEPDSDGDYRGAGFGLRAGLGTHYQILPFTHLGGAVHFGYHFFGSQRDNSGFNTMGQLYLRFAFGL